MEMPKMASMKMSKAERKKMFGMPMVAGSNGPDYPWGLTINLDAAALKKLGVEELPEAGEECMLHATGKVTRVSSSATDKKTDRSVEIQITNLSFVCADDGMEDGFSSVDKE